MKYPRASGALRWAPDPMLKRAHFTHTTLLHTVSNLHLSRSGPPPLIKSWICPWNTLTTQLLKWHDTQDKLAQVIHTMSMATVFHLVLDSLPPLSQGKLLAKIQIDYKVVPCLQIEKRVTETLKKKPKKKENM